MSLLVEQRGAVLVLTLNRPERRNALNAETMAGIGRALTDAKDDDSIATIVLTGAGDKVFSAGLDLKEFAEGGKAGQTDGPGLEVLLDGDYPKPIVAGANGSALAGGFELLLACDLVVAADHAVFGVPEVKRGLVAAGGGVLLLPRRVPLALALEMGLTGEPIDADRALAFGLINRVVPGDRVLDEALAMADAIAANAPLAVRFTKEHMRAAAEPDAATRKAFYAAVGPIFASKDAIEGATAFAEKRPPVWTGQ